MEKIIKGFKKNYKTINIAMLCICLYLLIFFPAISSMLEKISPVLTECPYLKLTGKPCPLCGGTRFLKNFKNVFYDISYMFNFFGLIVLIIIIEIVFRTINICKKEHRDIIIKFDLIIHIIMSLSYIVYSIYYISR